MCQPRVPFWRFLGSSAIKNPPDNAGDGGLSVQSLGSRSPGEGNGNILQCSWLENPMDREAWQATVHGAAKELDTTEQLNNNLMYLSIWGTGKGMLSFPCRDLPNHLVHTRVVSIVPVQRPSWPSHPDPCSKHSTISSICCPFGTLDPSHSKITATMTVDVDAEIS